VYLGPMTKQKVKQAAPFRYRPNDALRKRILAQVPEGGNIHATLTRLLTLALGVVESTLTSPVETQMELSDPPWEPIEESVTPNEVQIELCISQEPTQEPVKVESKPTEDSEDWGQYLDDV
jgi:hypothetical protein